MTKAVVYARFSSDNQRHESITAQLRACQEYANKKGYEIVREYTDEALSARTDDRPAFQQMIADAKDERFSVLICHKIDRFSRDRYDYAYYKRQLNKAGVVIDYVEQNIDNSPESIILESVLSGMSEYYSKNLAREAIKGMKENAYQCKHNGGTPPLGFDVGKDGMLIINDREAEIVKLIFSMRAAGESYGNIIDALNAKGYTSKSGNSFGKNSLYDILTNKKYNGWYVFGKSSTSVDGKRQNRQNREDIIEIPNSLPKIIDDATWHKVQERIQTSKRAPGMANAKESYLLTGKLVCGKCGSKMTGSRVKKKDNIFVYYRCEKKSAKKTECAQGYISKKFAEDNVLDSLFANILNPSVRKKLLSKLKKAADIASAAYKSEEKILLKQKQDIQRKIENLLNLAESGEVNSSIKKRLDENSMLLKEMESKLSSAKKTPYMPETEMTLVLQHYYEKRGDVSQNQHLIDTFIDSVIIEDKDIDINFYSAF